MKRNFKIDNSIAIKNEAEYLDLHNCYSLKNFNIDILNREVTLFWAKLERDWINKNDPELISLKFQNVYVFEMSKNFYEEHPKKIEEIGFKDASDYNYDWLNREDQSDEHSHIIFRFENDEYLRFFCEKITLDSPS